MVGSDFSSTLCDCNIRVPTLVGDLLVGAGFDLNFWTTAVDSLAIFQWVTTTAKNVVRCKGS